jgi:hypothetical protein
MVKLFRFFWVSCGSPSKESEGAAIAAGFSEAWRRCPDVLGPWVQWLRRLLQPGVATLGSAGTQPNEEYPGRGCVKVQTAAGGVTSPAAAYLKDRWTPALCLR